jgi:hypothetical protein
MSDIDKTIADTFIRVREEYGRCGWCGCIDIRWSCDPGRDLARGWITVDGD